MFGGTASGSASGSPLDQCNAQIRFAESLAAYSIFNYLMAVKDHDNGNIRLRSNGRPARPSPPLLPQPSHSYRHSGDNRAEFVVA